MSQSADLLALLSDGRPHEMRAIHRAIGTDKLSVGATVAAALSLRERAYQDPDEWLSRFVDRIEVGNRDQCWKWLGAPGSHGYGAVWSGRKVFLAHRVMYEMFVGDIPKGLTIDHLCSNRLCVNPFHLEVVSRAENGRRGSVKRWAAVVA